ncbi:MAG: pyruvate dehydrogenase (acetyl-transferring), homodimeric type [Myxococcales bacterium]|nr:pyruvate dehydrogenase (acetyl-transferring), homodimeric type [Myxococcales bacterium]
MQAELAQNLKDIDPVETQEWLDSFDALVDAHGMERAHFILTSLLKRAHVEGVQLPPLVQTPYINTIHVDDEPEYPGDEEIELRIRRYIRWNAVAMVMRGNERFAGLGGHLSTYASAATLYEVGFHHFFRGYDNGQMGDLVFFQGHASPGIYARAFLEGRISDDQLSHFRREVVRGQGLSSYPHPHLMPSFWQFPTVSMGLGPCAAIYQARFARYLHHRGIADTSRSRVWCFVGDGETDEPETLGSIQIASREALGNLIFVVNCNLQRLDGPVRGNAKIIQELEAVFHGAGWNVIKVIWGRQWDPLLKADEDGLLVRRMGEVVDGQFQKYSVEDGDYIRRHFFGTHPKLKKLVRDMGDDDIARLRRGGHDFHKVYAAYHAAVRETEKPTVVLAKTVKGWTLGEDIAGRNVTHQQKKLSLKELAIFRDRLELEIPDKQLLDPPYIRFDKSSREYEYLVERRKALGGFLPERREKAYSIPTPEVDWFKRYLKGSGSQEVPTTGAFSRMLGQLLQHESIGPRIVPIIPDEARTFGMDALFRKWGIYSSVGQLYEPVDAHMLLSYREAKDGQVLEEGICEAGAMASFIAAGSSYSNFGEPMIPMYIFYSMFGFQRVGDQVWAAGDQRCRGFLLGATAGRTTLTGEGLQHCDGHSHVLAATNPAVEAYDPAFAYEIAVLISEGLRRMSVDQENVIYYLTIQNESYQQPPMPDGVREGILDGIYLFEKADAPKKKRHVQLLGSGSILMEVRRARDLLAERFDVTADVWSVTSYNRLRREAVACERYNRLHPTAEQRVPKVEQVLGNVEGPIVAATDYMKLVPDQIAPWIELTSLGTDGFGRSDTRQALRRHFEIDAECIAVAALEALATRKVIDRAEVAKAIDDLGIDRDKPDPATA